MTDHEWDEVIDLRKKAHEAAMRAATHVVEGGMAAAHMYATMALGYERQAAEIESPRERTPYAGVTVDGREVIWP